MGAGRDELEHQLDAALSGLREVGLHGGERRMEVRALRRAIKPDDTHIAGDSLAGLVQS